MVGVPCPTAVRGRSQISFDKCSVGPLFDNQIFPVLFAFEGSHVFFPHEASGQAVFFHDDYCLELRPGAKIYLRCGSVRLECVHSNLKDLPAPQCRISYAVLVLFSCCLF